MKDARSLRTTAVTLMAVIAAAGLIRGLGPVGARAADGIDEALEAYRNRATVPINGYFRDFQPVADGGHPDFGLAAEAGGGRYEKVPQNWLGPAGVPAFYSTGYKVFRPWTDSSGRYIMSPRPYIDAMTGDVIGALSDTQGGAVSSAASFSNWFLDSGAPGVRGTLTFNRDAATGIYSYFGYLEGPSPSGSTAVDTADWSTTYAAETYFVHERGKGQYIEVATDGDAWIYVDGRLVIDSAAGPSNPWGFTGLAADGPIVLSNNTEVTLAPGTNAAVTTNASGDSSVAVQNSGRIVADVRVGPGADLATAVVGTSKITGTISAMPQTMGFPVINVPDTLGPSRGDVYVTGQTITWNESFRCRSLMLQQQVNVRVAGHVTIVVEDDLTFDNRIYIDLMPDSSLEIYVGDRMLVTNFVNINLNTGDPGLVTFFVLGTSTLEIPNNANIVANFLAPSAPVYMGNGVIVTGSMMGASVNLANGADFIIKVSGDGSETQGTWTRDTFTAMAQRIDLDRCDWLRDQRTYHLHMFFADRRKPKSLFAIQTSIDTLNLAVPYPELEDTD